MRARLAAYAMHAKHDSRETTAAGRAAFDRRFELQVDPDGVLPEEERLRRAEAARRAFYTRLALASSQARAARRRERGAEPDYSRSPGSSLR
jgi:hypothetical protein